VKAARDGFVAVLSRDGAGKVSVYYPYDGKEAAPYSAAQPLLPGAIALDETPGREDLWTLFSSHGFELAPYVEQLKRTGKITGEVQVTQTQLR
jgi:hypothetical protein